MNKQVLNAYKHFRQYGVGGLVGTDAQYCLALARIEHIADQAGIVPQWDYDQYCDRGPIDWGWPESEIKRWEQSSHECESCSVVTDDGEYAASLSGIWDADTDYRRLIEAELLLEAIPFNSTGMWLFSQ